MSRNCSTPGTNSSSISRNRRRRCQPASGPTRPDPPPRAPHHPSASCDALPRKGARPPGTGAWPGAAVAGHRPPVRRGSRTGPPIRTGPRSWHTRRRGVRRSRGRRNAHDGGVRSGRPLPRSPLRPRAAALTTSQIRQYQLARRGRPRNMVAAAGVAGGSSTLASISQA